MIVSDIMKQPSGRLVRRPLTSIGYLMDSTTDQDKYNKVKDIAPVLSFVATETGKTLRPCSH